jgi:hypothetical protein
MSLMKLLFSLCHYLDSGRLREVCLLQYEYQDEVMQGLLHLGLEHRVSSFFWDDYASS